jgi:hypothetical protein
MYLDLQAVLFATGCERKSGWMNHISYGGSDMRRLACLLTTTAICTLLMVPSRAHASVLIDSWENASEGWGTFQGDYAISGFSNTLGVTNGSFSMAVNSPSNTAPNYAGLMGGSATTTITQLLAVPGQTISVDVYTAPGSFSFMQWDLDTNGAGGYNSVDGFSYPESPVIGSETTLTWSIPPALTATYLANITTPTSLNFQIGGGQATGPATFYVDNLRASLPIPIPEPASLTILGGGLMLLGQRRRRA